MKNPLHFIGIPVLIIMNGIASCTLGQSILISEDFSGFITGTHSTPSTVDVSSSLDSKTLLPGWSGSLIYPSGGEIKIGTSSATGWIETPVLNLPAGGANITIKFDIARWINDATTVRVYFNDAEAGDLLTPTDNFQTVRINVTTVSASGKVKIRGVSKRFYLDNFEVTSEELPTGIRETSTSGNYIHLYPVPVTSRLTVQSNIKWDNIEITDITGRILMTLYPDTDNPLYISTVSLNTGLYLIRFQVGKYAIIKRFIKAGN